VGQEFNNYKYYIILTLATGLLALFAFLTLNETKDMVSNTKDQVKLGEGNLSLSNKQYDLNRKSIDSANQQFDETMQLAYKQLRINDSSLSILNQQNVYYQDNLEIATKQLQNANKNLEFTLQERILEKTPEVDVFDIRTEQVDIFWIWLENKNPYKLFNIQFSWSAFAITFDSTLNSNITQINRVWISPNILIDTMPAFSQIKEQNVFYVGHDLYLPNNSKAIVKLDGRFQKPTEELLADGSINRFVKLELKFRRELDFKEFKKNFFFDVWGYKEKEKGGQLQKWDYEDLIELYKNRAMRRYLH
jgi:hypothetical protein